MAPSTGTALAIPTAALSGSPHKAPGFAGGYLLKHPKHDDLTPMTKAMPLAQIRRQARASVRHRLGSHGTPPLNIHQKHQSVPGLATDVTSPRGWVILDASCRPAVSAERSSSMRRLLPPCLDAVR